MSVWIRSAMQYTLVTGRSILQPALQRLARIQGRLATNNICHLGPSLFCADDHKRFKLAVYRPQDNRGMQVHQPIVKLSPIDCSVVKAV